MFIFFCRYAYSNARLAKRNVRLTVKQVPKYCVESERLCDERKRNRMSIYIFVRIFVSCIVIYHKLSIYDYFPSFVGKKREVKRNQGKGGKNKENN